MIETALHFVPVVFGLLWAARCVRRNEERCLRAIEALAALEAKMTRTLPPGVTCEDPPVLETPEPPAPLPAARTLRTSARSWTSST